VRKVHPNDTDAKKKYDECNKIVRQEAFAKAIASEEKSIVDQIDISTMCMFLFKLLVYHL
jgi:serine/threonine-protein phosphatase 5